jgi:type VII secretion integral membrane protein EccD
VEHVVTTVSAGEMCRLVVCGPDSQIEMAVPTGVLVADLLPALLHHLGEDLADAGLLHGGWVLQRLGAPPLDEDASVADLDLRDGDVVHLRPRSEQIPQIAFDDLIDGVATGAQNRAGRWRPEMARWAAWTVLIVLFGLGLAAIALPGPPLTRAICAAAAALVCLLGAAGASRAAGERTAGLISACAGVAFGTLAGLIIPQPAIGLTLTGPSIFTAAVVAAAAATAAAFALGWSGPLVTGILAAATLTAAGAAVATFTSIPTPGAAGVVAVLGTVLVVAVPLTAFRLSGQRLTPLPTEPEHLQQDIDPEPSDRVLAGAAAADRYMTALYCGLAVPVTVSMVLLGFRPGWAPGALVLVLALARLLAARTMTSAWHRLAQALPALAGPVALALSALADAGPVVRLLTLPLLVVVGVPVVVLGRKLPGRRLMPYWGRIGDILQLISTIAALPVLLAVLGVYAYARALGG